MVQVIRWYFKVIVYAFVIVQGRSETTVRKSRATATLLPIYGWNIIYHPPILVPVVPALTPLKEVSLTSVPKLTTCNIKNKTEIGLCQPFQKCYSLLSTLASSKTRNGSFLHNLADEIRKTSEGAGCPKAKDVCCAISEDSGSRYIPKRPSVGGGNNYPYCGESSPFSPAVKITGGYETYPGQFPWMAIIYGKSGNEICGGSLISQDKVLTAAHCFNHYRKSDVSKIRVVLGDYDVSTLHDMPSVIRKVSKIIRHKYFGPKSFVNDIALLKLAKPVTFHQNIRPVCFPQRHVDIHVNDKFTVVGWGRTSFDGPHPSRLHQVEVKAWRNSRCHKKYKGLAPRGILPTMLCCGEPGRDACIGDSGGPLMYKSGRKWIQIGIVSFGKGCGGEWPGVYTRVDDYAEWIRSNIGL